MKERPILFSAPMVRAILEDRKTQTRRVVANVDADGTFWKTPARASGLRHTDGRVPFGVIDWCPYGQPGDRLWVREAFRFPMALDGDSPAKVGERAIDAGYRKAWCPTRYEADDAISSHSDWLLFGSRPGDAVPGRYRNPRHMPRWASRIDLEVTGVRVERLQDISEADAIAEGIELLHGRYTFNGGLHESRSAVNAFFALWDSVHGQGAWDANPWVWVVEFRRLNA